MISNRIVQKNSAVTNRLWGWGANTANIIKNTGGPFSTPVSTDRSQTFFKVSHGENFACGIDTNNTLWCWGKNTYGQLGDGTTGDTSNPIQINGTWNSVSCGRFHVLAIKSNQYLYSWGRNNYGQLGLGNTTNYSIPFRVGSNLYIKASAGENHSLGIQKISGEYGYLRTWGRNNYGQVGDGTTNNRSTPQSIGSYYWKEVAGGQNHSLALRYNINGFYSWGKNQTGQLGLGNTNGYSSPVLSINPVNAIISFVYARGNNSAFKYNSNIYTFGSNNKGQLGNNNTINQSVPVLASSSVLEFNMVGSDNSVTSFYINTSYKLYSCGYGGSYLKGDGTTADSSVFAQVGSYTDWRKLSNGGHRATFMLATRY